MKKFVRPKTIEKQMEEQGFYKGKSEFLFFAEPLSNATSEDYTERDKERKFRAEQNSTKLLENLLEDYSLNTKEIYIRIEPAKTQRYGASFSTDSFCSKFQVYFRE